MVKVSKKRRVRKKATRRQRGGGVPHVCFQTSKDPIKLHIVKHLKKHLGPDWTYKHFTDAQILEFFHKERHPDYPAEKLVEHFHSFSHGEHKADLFRYYYLLVKGGVFIDSDLLLEESLSKIVRGKEFVSVRALQPVGSVFNGFLAATPNHPIIQAAMKHIMSVTNEQLVGHYHLLVAELGTFVDAHMKPSVKLLAEVSNDHKSCPIEDPDTGKVVMIHYHGMDPPNSSP